jgi:hypothetical protein
MNPHYLRTAWFGHRRALHLHRPTACGTGVLTLRSGPTYWRVPAERQPWEDVPLVTAESVTVESGESHVG